MAAQEVGDGDVDDADTALAALLACASPSCGAPALVGCVNAVRAAFERAGGADLRRALAPTAVRRDLALLARRWIAPETRHLDNVLYCLTLVLWMCTSVTTARAQAPNSAEEDAEVSCTLAALAAELAPLTLALPARVQPPNAMGAHLRLCSSMAELAERERICPSPPPGLCPRLFSAFALAAACRYASVRATEGVPREARLALQRIRRISHAHVVGQAEAALAALRNDCVSNGALAAALNCARDCFALRESAPAATMRTIDYISSMLERRVRDAGTSTSALNSLAPALDEGLACLNNVLCSGGVPLRHAFVEKQEPPALVLRQLLGLCCLALRLASSAIAPDDVSGCGAKLAEHASRVLFILLSDLRGLELGIGSTFVTDFGGLGGLVAVCWALFVRDAGGLRRHAGGAALHVMRLCGQLALTPCLALEPALLQCLIRTFASAFCSTAAEPAPAGLGAAPLPGALHEAAGVVVSRLLALADAEAREGAAPACEWRADVLALGDAVEEIFCE